MNAQRLDEAEKQARIFLEAAKKARADISTNEKDSYFYMTELTAPLVKQARVLDDALSALVRG